MTATAERADVLLVGNPNSGKSLLFTRLTGIAQKVANYPGVTVEVRSGHAGSLTIHDYPGIYSLEPLTLDERVAIEKLDAALGDPGTRAIVCVLDATRLERSLYLLLELIPRARAAHVPVIAAVNVLDEVVGAGSRIDVAGLTAEGGGSFVGVSARTGEGMEALRAALARPEDTAGANPEVAAATTVEERKRLARNLDRAHGPRTDVLLRSQERLDRVFLSTAWGLPIFFAVMAVLFQAIFTWAAPLMAAVRVGVAAAGGVVSGPLPARPGHRLVRHRGF